MTTWIIEPRDALIVRDGRPFGPNPGARAASIPFPYPSITTGAVRTRAGLGTDGVFDKALIPKMKTIAVKGPVLVELDSTHGVRRWLFPAPLDALLLEPSAGESTSAIRKLLVPLQPPANAETNLPDILAVVGPLRPDPRKPIKAPRFWYWESISQWLLSPAEDVIQLPDLGHDGPKDEQRTHVRIQADTLTALEGALFQTRGLEFTHVPKECSALAASDCPTDETEERKSPPPPKQRLALAVMTDAALAPGLAPMGGERRLVNWRQVQVDPPGCPVEIRDAILRDKACRIVLVTPACFKHGYRPEWLLEPQAGVTVQLKALALSRMQVVSGWNFELGRPKPTRRLAPAGTVLFVTLQGEDQAVEQWIDRNWMQCISDEEQDRWDGFGLVVLGTWSGIPQRMEWDL